MDASSKLWESTWSKSHITADFIPVFIYFPVVHETRERVPPTLIYTLGAHTCAFPKKPETPFAMAALRTTCSDDPKRNGLPLYLACQTPHPS